MENIPEEFVDWLVGWTQLGGYSILLVTFPLAIVQSFIGIYPFAALVLLNVSAVGLAEGLLTSWLMGILGTILAYLACKKWLSNWIRSKWLNKLKRYEKVERYMDRYGIWTLIVLRLLPIMPNNLISFMASLSSISFTKYCWSSVWGLLLHIGFVGLLSSAVFFPDIPIWQPAVAFSALCLGLIAVFVCQQWVFAAKRAGNPAPLDHKSNERTL